MIKRILISFLVLILLLASYWGYCELFWHNYFNQKFFNDLDFHSHSTIPSDSSLNRENFQNYKWSREIIEPMHGQWINKTTIYFSNDTTMNVTVNYGYIHKNYFYYPIFRDFISSEDQMNETYNFDKERLQFSSRWVENDTISIQLNKKTITIDYSFL